jgi:hypothetical protein
MMGNQPAGVQKFLAHCRMSGGTGAIGKLAAAVCTAGRRAR